MTITVSIDYALDSLIYVITHTYGFTLKQISCLFIIGFESDPGNPKDSMVLNVPQLNPFNSSSSSLMNCCWPDEWTPGALVDTTSSFCSAYLESSRVAMEYEVRNPPEVVSEGEMLRMPPGPSADININNFEAAIQIDDDVFF